MCSRFAATVTCLKHALSAPEGTPELGRTHSPPLCVVAVGAGFAANLHLRAGPCTARARSYAGAELHFLASQGLVLHRKRRETLTSRCHSSPGEHQALQLPQRPCGGTHASQRWRQPSYMVTCRRSRRDRSRRATYEQDASPRSKTSPNKRGRSSRYPKPRRRGKRRSGP